MENKTTGNVQHSFNPQLASFMTRSSTNKNVNGKPSHHFLRFHFENTCCSIAALRFFCLLVAFFLFAFLCQFLLSKYHLCFAVFVVLPPVICHFLLT
jgi:hypothetical protein